MTSRGEAREAIRSALLDWRDSGVVNPVMPVYSDLDGDGVPDYYGLDSFGQLTVVSGADMPTTNPVESTDQEEGP